MRNNISLVVCDMAGTIINEKGIIYKTMFNTLKSLGFNPNRDDINNWYGLDKSEVLRSYVSYNKIKEAEKVLIKNLEKEYFEKSQIDLIDDNLFDFFDNLRIKGIKVTLNTGYPKSFQSKIINHFDLNSHVDSYISSEEVSFGRPYPYMIFNLIICNFG